MADIQTTHLYCLADRRYYEAPYRMADMATRFSPAVAPTPDGWYRLPQGIWTLLAPQGHRLPGQGWKIHISAVPEEAANTLAISADICFAAGAQFKYLRSEDMLRLMSATHAPRATSGKFVTVYPGDEDQFCELVAELSAALAGRRGPNILSDLRIGDSPVHVRYGAFRLQYRPGPDGVPVPVLGGSSGALEPDERRPVFRVPPTIILPTVLVPHLVARETATESGPPYAVREALHFTNAGGVYLADDPHTGDRLVLREGRQHSGLDRFGADAPARLRREYATLRRLAGLPCVPQVFGLHQVWGHLYLAEEYIEGESLFQAVIARNPLIHVGHTRQDLADYASWVDDVVGRVGEALAAVHARGMAFGDLHPGNIIVRPDGSVALVDFEYAADLEDEAAPRVGAAGLIPPAHLSGAQADLYALDMLKLSMLMPVTELRDRHPGKAGTLTRLAQDRFPLPAQEQMPAPDADEDTVRALFGIPADDAGWLDGRCARPDWLALRHALVAGVHAAATPDRADQLFPGPPEAFSYGGHTLAHGAAGVLGALHHVGEPVPEAYTEWLLAAARRADPATGGGLFHGLHGTAAVLADLGFREEARELLDRASEPPSSAKGLATGVAGVGLVRLRLGDVAKALQIGERLASDLSTPPDEAGLLRGMSGPALLHLALHRTTGDAYWLRAARLALARDVARCVTRPDGTVHVRRLGDRYLVYLGAGSAGVALVAHAYLAAAGDEDSELAALVAGTRLACTTLFVREPGLLQGRAGLVVALAELGASRDVVTAQAARLAWHTVHDSGALLVPGPQLLRFSADLATGAAGVLVALRAALTDTPVSLLSLLSLDTSEG
ncbi:class III lanthionine synthetase LanKC [Streptomyces sp. Isolate_45]|uniref:class III lanthionine synthetase LanKC n=1 Tax=Streptomyces sp. Isolate_45 TaxID=2950111 RepID=UPI002481B86D|nr:class III lanthionine synthetase LanKC [Streptomyces sp. Isolate_45]MDA5280912.1 class III lanthionine synthetase LanKC [Streptomyces sp. Isolate_45]